MNPRLFLVLMSFCVITACTVVNRHYDEVIPLVPEMKEEGNALLRTQTLWTTDSESIMVQVVKIDEYNVGVRYMYLTDFSSHPNFPRGFSFGKRHYRIPPGQHRLLVSYRGEMSYVKDSANRNHEQLIPFEVSIPPDSICVLLPDLARYKTDARSPKITLTCKEKEESGFALLRDLL